jgi:hypothetical protein
LNTHRLTDALAIYTHKRLGRGLDIYKLLLTYAAPEKSLPEQNNSLSRLLTLFIDVKVGRRNCDVISDEKHKIYFFLEMMLRNHHSALMQMNRCQLITIITSGDFIDYIQGRSFTSEECSILSQTIDYVTGLKILSPQDASDIKKTLRDKLSLKDRFPDELKPALQKSSGRNLATLFSLLQHLLYPEVNLPATPIDSEAHLAYEHQSFASPAIIRQYQNILNLRKFLEFTHDEALTMLCQCTDMYGKNHAGDLLAEILLYHHEDVIVVDGHEEKLLNEDHLKSGVQLLQNLYSMSRHEKITMGLYHKQAETIATQTEMINSLTEKVDHLTSMVDSLLRAMAARRDKREEVQEGGAKVRLFKQ